MLRGDDSGLIVPAFRDTKTSLLNSASLQFSSQDKRWNLDGTASLSVFFQQVAVTGLSVPDPSVIALTLCTITSEISDRLSLSSTAECF